jgi:hypothetical protein
MAIIKARPNGTFQLRVKNKLLPKLLRATFDWREAAEQYGGQLERLLAQGIVAAALLEQTAAPGETWTIGRCMAEYIRHNSVPISDVKILMRCDQQQACVPVI